ncbi:hypothetical protein Tco_1105990 [Tanacetum coccineum]
MLSVCFLFVLVVQKDLYSIEASRVNTPGWLERKESGPSPGEGHGVPPSVPNPPGWLEQKESGPSPGEGHGVPPSVPNPPGWLAQKKSGPSPLGKGHKVPNPPGWLVDMPQKISGPSPRGKGHDVPPGAPGRWVMAWSNDFEDLRQIQIPNLNAGREDTAVWVASNGNEQKFKISNVWKERSNDTKVDWYSMVWYAQSMPRPNEDFKCALCNKCPDSHNQVFFTCDFSKEIWNELLKKLNVRLSGCWD